MRRAAIIADKLETPSRRVKRYGGLTWEESDEEPEESAQVARERLGTKDLCPVPDEPLAETGPRPPGRPDAHRQSAQTRAGAVMSSDDPRKDYLAKLILDQLVVGGEGLADGEEDFLDQLSGDKALQASLVQKGGGVDIRLSAGVLMPLLKKSVKDDPGITALMNDLEASLARMVRGNRGSRADVDINNVAGILTLQDELDFWLELRDDRYSAQRETIPDSLSKIQQNLAIDSSVDDDTFTEMLDDSVEILDSIGDEEYPKARMAHLLKLIGDRVIEFMRARVAEKSIWKTSFAAADRELNSAKSICEFWRKTTVSRGCKDPRLDGLLERLGKLLQLRKTQDAIKDLLSDDEQRLLLSDTAKALEGSEIKALQVNAHSMNSWKGALSEYNVAMKPVLQKVMQCFAKRGGSVGSSPSSAPLYRKHSRVWHRLKKKSRPTSRRSCCRLCKLRCRS